MKICKNCGSKHGDETVFCPQCGQKTEDLIVEPKVQEMPEMQTQPDKLKFFFCGSCGEKLEGEATFCTNCGASCAPGGTAGKKAQKKDKTPVHINWKQTGIIGGAAIVVILVVVLIASGVFQNRATKFVKIQEKMLLNNVQKVLDTALNNEVSTDCVISGSVSSSNEISNYLDDLKLVLKTDIKDDDILLNGELFNSGTTELSAEASYKDGVIGFYAPALSNDYYTLDVEEFMQNSGINLYGIKDIDSKTANAAMEAVFSAAATAVNTDNVEVNSNAYAELENLGETVKCTQYIFRPTAGDIKEAVMAIAEVAKNDENVRKYLLDLMKLDYNYSDYSDAEMEANLDNAIDEMVDEADSLGEMAESNNFTWSVWEKGGRVYKQEIGGGEEKYVYESYGKTKSSRADLICYTDGYSSSFLKNEYSRSGKEINGSLISSSYGEETSLNYNVNLGKKSGLGIYYGTYTLSTPYSGAGISLNVKKSKNGTDHIISLTNAGDMFYDLYYYNICDMEICVNTTDKKSTATVTDMDKVDITNYDEYEIEEIMEDMNDSFEIIGSNIFD